MGAILKGMSFCVGCGPLYSVFGPQDNEGGPERLDYLAFFKALEGIVEAAPQLALQSYIVIHQAYKNVAFPSILYVSIPLSLCSLGVGVVGWAIGEGRISPLAGFKGVSKYFAIGVFVADIVARFGPMAAVYAYEPIRTNVLFLTMVPYVAFLMYCYREWSLFVFVVMFVSSFIACGIPSYARRCRIGPTACQVHILSD